VTAKHARAAVRDSEFGARRFGVPNAWWFIGAGLVAGLLVGVGLHFANQLRPAHGAAQVAAPMTAAPAPSPQPSGIATQDRPVQVALPSGERPELPQTAPPASPAAPPSAPAAVPISQTPSETAASQPPAAAPAGSKPPLSGKLAQERFASTQKWLKVAPNASWTIQVLTAGDVQLIERFLEEAAQEVELKDMYVYGVKVNGRQFYGVTYGNYPTLEDTITAMGDLPTSFKTRGPFHRSIGVMRRQNQE
jgi:septal ring-binding cell division protein DamX